MGKVGLFTITYANASEIFYPGQNVQGEVQLQVKEEVKIREIRLTLGGFAHVLWTESHGNNTVTYTSGENYFEEVILCQTPPNGEKNMMLQPGSYRYPFQFQLPLGIPASFEGHFGRVCYYAKATMDRPWAFDEKVTSYYTVLNLLDLNALPDAKEPGNADGSKTLCCLCCKSGPISGRHRLDRIGYVPGEAIPIMAECINHSSRDVKMTSMELVQYVCGCQLPYTEFQISSPPSFASFSTNQNSGKEGKGNAVQPSDEMQMSNFQPQYPYYNWNQYDNNFKPTSY